MNSRSSSSSTLTGSSRAKRSTTNLASLRLTPLSPRYVEADPKQSDPGDGDRSNVYSSRHSSYLQGKSAPTSPGILSRSSSRRRMHGLSRRSSLYDNEPQEVMNYEYTAVVRDKAGGTSVESGPGRIPKAKSEAALLVQRNQALQQGAPSRMQGSRHHSRSTTGGSVTPRTKVRRFNGDGEWIARTGAAANAILQESKGQSWFSSRSSSTHLQDTSDEDDDEGYEEMAALSTGTTRLQSTDDDLTPTNTRIAGWGSRYGSRSNSRRPSRRGSFSGGSIGGLAPLTPGSAPGVGVPADELALSLVEPDFVGSEEELDSQDEAAVDRLVDGKSFGLGGVVDRLMNFNLFKVEEREEMTDEEVAQVNETEAQAQERMALDRRRKQEEKEKLTNLRGGAREGDRQVEGGWSDVSWLLSVASKVIL